MFNKRRDSLLYNFSKDAYAGGLKNPHARAIINDLKYLTEENLGLFRDKYKLRMYFAFLGKPLRDSQVDEASTIVKAIQKTLKRVQKALD